ncbi:neuronal PAS domain-containing protein 3 isoform X1 [Tachysurus ichikawai]
MIWAFLYPVGCSNEPTGLLRLTLLPAAPLPPQQPMLPKSTSRSREQRTRFSHKGFRSVSIAHSSSCGHFLFRNPCQEQRTQTKTLHMNGFSSGKVEAEDVELTGSSVFDYVHPGDQVEMAEQLGMKIPPGRSLLSQGAGAEDGASSASSSSHSETPEPEGSSVEMQRCSRILRLQSRTSLWSG